MSKPCISSIATIILQITCFMVLFFLQGGFCPLGPAVTLPVESHNPLFLFLFPQKEPFAWTETLHITFCQVEKCISIIKVSLLMLKLSLCLTFHLSDASVCDSWLKASSHHFWAKQEDFPSSSKTCVSGRPTGGVSRQLNVVPAVSGAVRAAALTLI